MCGAPATKSALLCLPRTLHIEVHKALRLPRNLQTSHMSKTHDCTCHEIRARRRSPPCPKYCTCHENCTSKKNSSDPLHLSRKVDFGAPNTRFPLCLPRKVTTMYENAHGATTRAQSLEAPAAATQTLRACAVEIHFEDFERHECAVNSSELAGHGRAAHLSKHTYSTLTVRTCKNP